MLEKGPDDAQKYRGNEYRAYLREKGPDDAHKYRGSIQQFRFKRNPNSAKEALKRKPTNKVYYKKKPYQGNIKVTSKRKPNKSAAEEALQKKYPDKNYFKGGEYQGNIKANWTTKRNPSSAEDALEARPPGKGTAKGMEYQGRLKMPTYKKRPNAVEGALKGIGPSSASIQASNYQGNIKMRKKRIEDRHPDFKYLRSRTNGKAEKDKVFSFKLLWSKIFKKNENQPDNLKQKDRKPRYDKKEQDIWYD
ncbi:hypothetical protein JMN32_01525 [Fulvivirga sp. 29W222]|uniref:Uncharacterized protein n=1 Tax=Fulvivirga marina TaxID=2494733 RepID=A0A937FT08_9BACT|nr:hypothetical protein [Fulvivirga marina]MBL6444970.1 hypothetical protein [Fulvivirga marina]